MKREYSNTHTHKHTIPNVKFKLKLLQIKYHVLEFTQDKAQNVLQRIMRVFAEAFVSHDRHTLFALEESGPPRMTYTCESHIWQMDVKMTFLYGNLTEDVYMTQIEGFVDHKYARKICKLQKSIYGPKQASQSWNLCFNQVVKGFGFIKNMEEPCVYKKVSGSTVVFLVLYVDDILLIGNDIPIIEAIKSSLRKSFSMKDL
jgi:hypothetical protein